MGISALSVNRWKQVPRSVKLFLYRAFFLLVFWKIVYLLFLMPSRVFDRPITQFVGKATTVALNFIMASTGYSSQKEFVPLPRGSGTVWIHQEAIYYKSVKTVAIEDACNGLELFVLYAGFIICLPAAAKRKSLFVLYGLIMILSVNVFRCAGITLLIQYHPSLVDFTHHYLFTFIAYMFVVWLWLIFSKKLII